MSLYQEDATNKAKTASSEKEKSTAKTEPVAKTAGSSIAEKIKQVETGTGTRPALSSSYTKDRKIKIERLNNQVTKSYYRLVNFKATGDMLRVQSIGSCYNSTTKLLTTSNELAHYLPSIIGVQATSEQFGDRAKAWLDNLSIPVGEEGRVLDISFTYKSESDYKEFVTLEAKIEEDYDKAPKNPITKLKEADKARNLAIHNLEAVKFEFGFPVNVVDYLIWRHCLLYSHVLKEVNLAPISPQARFYIVDEAREKRRALEAFSISKKALSKYIEIIDNEEIVSNIVWAYSTNIPVVGIETLEDKQRLIKSIVDGNPSKFLDLANDKELAIKALIENLISRGVFSRLEGSQVIVNGDNETIGRNIRDAIEYFKDPLNANIVSSYKKMLQ